MKAYRNACFCGWIVGVLVLGILGKGNVDAAERRAAGERQVFSVGGIEHVFRWCPPGNFTMGASEQEWRDAGYPPGYLYNELQHRVTLTQGFWLLETPVTRAMWRTFLQETGYTVGAGKNGGGAFGWNGQTMEQSPQFTWENPGFPQTETHPVTAIGWEDCMAYCRWLGKTLERNVTLPTEAQWEYACRAGTTTVFSFGDQADAMARHGNVLDKTFQNAQNLPPNLRIPETEDGFVFTSPVRSFAPNAWGLYDMHGNVFEAVRDWYGPYPEGDVTDPTGPANGEFRANRGGSWDYYLRSARSAARGWDALTATDASLGFRPCFQEAVAPQNPAMQDPAPPAFVFSQAQSDALYAALFEALNACQTGYAPETHAFHGTPIATLPTAAEVQDLWPNPVGYGTGLEDCALYGGTMLAGVLELYDLTQDERLRSIADDLFNGLKGMGTAHGVRGFVARGVSPEDGKSTYITSSRDQYTHYVDALWRYFHSPLCSEESKAEIRILLSAVADAMEREITPENEFGFLRADGTKDPRGLHLMEYVYDHEAARLPMFYAAAYDVTGDERYKKLRQKYEADAIQQSLRLPSRPSQETNYWVPPYCFHQMQCSLALLYRTDADSAQAADVLRAMRSTAQFAVGRSGWIAKNGSLRQISEMFLAQTFSPELPATEMRLQLLHAAFDSLERVRKAGVDGTTHLFRAFGCACRCGLIPVPRPNPAIPGPTYLGKTAPPRVQDTVWKSLPVRQETDLHQIFFLGGANPDLARLATACNQIAALRPRPAAVVLFGNLTEDEPALQTLSQAGIPVFSSRSPRVLELPRADFLQVDTTEGLAEKIAPYRVSKKPFFIVSSQPLDGAGKLVAETESFQAFLYGGGGGWKKLSSEFPRQMGLPELLPNENIGYCFVQLEKWETVFRPLSFQVADVQARGQNVLKRLKTDDSLQ